MARRITDVHVDHEPISAHYKLQEFIGGGSFGSVVLAEHMLTKTKVAVKIINRWGCQNLRKFLLQEVRCLANLHHPNIIQLFHVTISEESLFLIMEFVPTGDLMEYLNDYGSMSEDKARRVFRQLFSAVHYCHSKGIAHRDLKPQNVLLDPAMNAKLIDFGLGAPSNIHRLSLECGTCSYTAPEVTRDHIYDGCAADIWSLGVVLHETLTNTLPFLGVRMEEVLERLGHGQYDMPAYLSVLARNLLRKMLRPKPAQRKSLRAIMPHPWLNIDEEEELKPYIEPPRGSIDPWVIEKMETMGFHQEDINDALSKNMYNNTTATYYMLKNQKPTSTHRIIKVKPLYPPKLQSRSPSPAQEFQQQLVDHKPGQKAQESGGGPSHVLEPITEPRAISPSASTEAKTASAERSRGPRTTTFNLPKPRYCWGPRTAPREHRPGSGPGCRLGRRTSNFNLPKLLYCWGSGTTPAEHRPGSGAASPEHRQGSGTTSPDHRPGSGAASPEHRPGSGAASPEHRPGSRAASPEHRPGSRATSPEHRPGSRATSAEHRPGSRAASPEHRRGSGTTSPDHRPGSRAASPEHRPGSRATSAEHRPGSRATSAEHRPGSRDASPEHRPGSETAIPELSPGSSTSSRGLASQCHPWDSLSSHSTTSGSARAEENKQGRCRMAVRCLNFFRKIFCLPPKKGHRKTRKAP